MATSKQGHSVLRRLGFATLALLCGGPLLLFFAVITWGAILLPLVGLLILAPFVLVNYLLWA